MVLYLIYRNLTNRNRKPRIMIIIFPYLFANIMKTKASGKNLLDNLLYTEDIEGKFMARHCGRKSTVMLWKHSWLKEGMSRYDKPDVRIGSRVHRSHDICVVEPLWFQVLIAVACEFDISRTNLFLKCTARRNRRLVWLMFHLHSGSWSKVSFLVPYLEFPWLTSPYLRQGDFWPYLHNETFTLRSRRRPYLNDPRLHPSKNPFCHRQEGHYQPSQVRGQCFSHTTHLTAIRATDVCSGALVGFPCSRHFRTPARESWKIHFGKLN